MTQLNNFQEEDQEEIQMTTSNQLVPSQVKENRVSLLSVTTVTTSQFGNGQIFKAPAIAPFASSEITLLH